MKNLWKTILLAVAATLGFCASGWATSPETLARGGQLFQHHWNSNTPAATGDGLGPLFNGTSCVTCHHQGGVGGSGDSRFNAKTLSIEKMRVNQSLADLGSIVSGFYPGFVQPNGMLLNSTRLAHHGGTHQFAQARSALLAQIPAVFSPFGGPVDSFEVRQVIATPIAYHRLGPNGKRLNVSIQARIYQRNTMPLFGLGLIDQVSDKLIADHAKMQKRHPEISGRPSTLLDGRLGKFGWRANVGSLLEFNDRACASEMGLQTRRQEQPLDPTNPSYRNPAKDITDKQIEAIHTFVSSLPAPVQKIPDDSSARVKALRGEQVFASVGCAVCHVPNMGPAKGVFSDLLLHDMGSESVDLNHAEPYIVKATPQTRVGRIATTTESRGSVTTVTPRNYYGPSSQMPPLVRNISIDSTETTYVSPGQETLDPSESHKNRCSTSGNRSNTSGPSRPIPSRPYLFVAPDSPQQRIQLVSVSDDVLRGRTRTSQSTDIGHGLGNVVEGSITKKRTDTYRKTDYLRLRIEPTKFNQEWRTPPLWGVRDSAPYMHDGRAETMLEAIAMHDGEASGTRDRFLALPLKDRRAVIAFLDTLVAPGNVPKPGF